VTRLVAILTVVVALYCGWLLYLRWEQARTREEAATKETVAEVVNPENLPCLPAQLEPTLQAAQKQGPAGLRNWLRTYGQRVQDPRKAWIELDYAVAIARDDPVASKRVFASVKQRTPPASPIWPRVKRLEKSFE